MASSKTSTKVKRNWNKKHYTGVHYELPIELVANFKATCSRKKVSQAQIIKSAMETFTQENCC